MTEIGDLVRSAAGRDKGRIFIVVGKRDGMFLLSDGRIRPAVRPKLKKSKHFERLFRPENPILDKLREGIPLTNSEVKKVIAAVRKENLVLEEQAWQKMM